MKKCRMCDHCGYTNKGEKVCTKRLIYIEDIQGDFQCGDFLVGVQMSFALGVLTLSIVLLLLLTALI